MNKPSLSHNYAQKQLPSSWTDDPFNLKGAFKGLTPVTHKRNLNEYAEELAYNYGRADGDNYFLSFYHLPEEEQNELAHLYMEATERDTSECVHGDDFSINNNYTCALLALLKEDCQETRDTFADVTRKNILTYYTPALQLILDEACNELHCNMMNEQGYSSRQDLESGDVIWGKY